MTTSALSNKQNEHKNQRRKPKQARALQKYNAVLDACTQVLGQQGYPKTTMLELSLESGVAVPTIYQYFENKEAILLAWMNRMVDRMLLSVQSIQQGLPSHTPITALVKILLQGSLIALQEFQAAATNLLQGLPQTLSRQLLDSLEDKTLTMLLTRFPAFTRQLGTAEAAETKLRVLIKLVCGFLMFSLLKGEDNAQLQIQGRELEDLILLYLQQHGVA